VALDINAMISGLSTTAGLAGRSSAVDALRKRNQQNAARARQRTGSLIEGLTALAQSQGSAAAAGGGGGGGGGSYANATATKGNGPGKGLVTIRTPNGGTVTVAANYASRFQGLLTDLWNAGYHFKSVGGYSYRNIAGTNTLSKHATGEAIDIDAQPNRGTRLGGGGNPYGYFNPSVAIAIAKKWGLDWGGTWKGQEDPMHFSTGG
jgi:hypothetical protein